MSALFFHGDGDAFVLAKRRAAQRHEVLALDRHVLFMCRGQLVRLSALRGEVKKRLLVVPDVKGGGWTSELAPRTGDDAPL